MRQSSSLLVKMDKKYFTFGPTEIWEDNAFCILGSRWILRIRRAFHKHRKFLKGTAQSFSAFFASTYELCRPTSRQGAAFTFPKPLRIVSVDNIYVHHYRGRGK